MNIYTDINLLIVMKLKNCSKYHQVGNRVILYDKALSEFMSVGWTGDVFAAHSSNCATMGLF